jgi:SMODS-associating 2TM, beta-strand rich effector domain
MRPYQVDFKRYLGFFAIGACLAYYIATERLGIGRYEFLAKIGLIATVATAAWVAFERYLWRWPIFRTLGLVDVPDLNGYWKGEVRRVGSPAPRPVTIRIRQTLTMLTIYSEGAVARTESISATILKGVDHQCSVISYWRGTAFDNINNDTLEDFYGASRFRVIYSGNRVTLEEHFFTNRNPQTKGVGWYRRAS